MDRTPKAHSWGWWVLAYVGLGLLILVGHGFVRQGFPGWLAGRVTKKATARLTASSIMKSVPAGTVWPADAEKDHLRQIKRLARDYEEAKGVAPRDIKQLRKWAVANGKADPEDFISRRDGQLYDLISDAAGVVVMEHTGRNGKKFVAGLGGVAFERDDKEGAGQPPSEP